MPPNACPKRCLGVQFEGQNRGVEHSLRSAQIQGDDFDSKIGLLSWKWLRVQSESVAFILCCGRWGTPAQMVFSIAKGAGRWIDQLACAGTLPLGECNRLQSNAYTHF